MILLFLASIECSHEFSLTANPGSHVTEEAHITTRMVTEEGESTKIIPGTYGSWEIKITEGAAPWYPDTINITYTPQANKKGCKNIRLAQTVKLVAYNQSGKKVTSYVEKIYIRPELHYRKFNHLRDDTIQHGEDLYVIDHLKCEGDPFVNSNDKNRELDSRGDATAEKPKSTTFEDTPFLNFKLIQENIKEIVLTFETVAICADTGELLGSVSWQCVVTQSKLGTITLLSTKEEKPSEAFEKALEKYVENHSREKVEGGVKVMRWYCPETSDKIKGPGGIFSNPWGEPIPEEFKKKWITGKVSKIDFCDDKNLPPKESEEKKEETGKMKKRKLLKPSKDVIGGGQHFEFPSEALDAGLNNVERSALKFTWSGDQTKPVRGILFTPYESISPEDVAPFIEDSDRFVNDFSALEAYSLPVTLMNHLLELMTAYAEPLENSNGFITVSIIANLGTAEATAYTGALLPEHVTSFITDAALHRSVDQETLEIFHYIGLNFGTLEGSQHVLPTEFFVDPETGEPNVVIVVGSNAAEMDGESAAMLAEKINAMALPDAPAVVVMTDTDFSFTDWKADCDYNLILVGGPVANTIVRFLVDEGFSNTNWTISPGEREYITAYSNGCNILVIAGADRDVTRLAVQALIQWL